MNAALHHEVQGLGGGYITDTQHQCGMTESPTHKVLLAPCPAQPFFHTVKGF